VLIKGRRMLLLTNYAATRQEALGLAITLTLVGTSEDVLLLCVADNLTWGQVCEEHGLLAHL